MAKRIHAFVSGRVQGVFFRSFVRSQAVMRSINGWAKNLSDGRVEIVAEGDQSGLESFLETIRQGTPEAEVDGVEVRNERPTSKFKEFSIR